MAEFMFVNLNEPTQNKRREVRKLVRSHVSYMQHSQKRTELGQVQKPTKSRYTDRSVNGWAVLDDGRAGQRSQLKLKAASGLNSGLLAQHQSTLPGSDPIRSPRQLYNEEITAPTKSQHRPRQIQRQPKASTSPTPIPGDEVNAMKESPQTVSTLPIIKSEVYVTSPGGVIVKQEQEDQTDRKWDIVSQHSSGSQSLSSPFTSEWRWEGDESQSTSLPFFFSNLGDPTDELRNRIELSRMSMSSVMVFSANTAAIMGQDCDRMHSLPQGSMAKHLLASCETNPAARAVVMLASIAAIRTCRREPIRCAALFGLRGYAISCLQAAMSDPETRYSDSTALAIASMGNFELYLGCEEVRDTHIQGLACLRQARRGTMDWITDRVLSWVQNVCVADISRGASAVLMHHPIET